MDSRLLASLDEGACVVTANLRLARAVAAAHGERRQRSAWLEPDVLPWDLWIERQWRASLYAGDAPPLLTPAQEIALWQHVIARYPGCDGVIDIAAAAQLARDAWRLAHEWELPLQPHHWQAQEDTAVFLDWALSFQRELRRLNRLDSASLDDFVSTRFAPASRELWLAGFDELTPRRRRITAALESRGWRVTRLVPPQETPGNALRLPLPNPDAEVEAAAAWAQARLRAHPSARIGIVFTRLDRVRDIVDRIFSHALPQSFHLALGPALAAHPLVAAALTALELSAPTVSFSTVSKALASPFFSGAETERSSRALFDLALRGEGLHRLTLIDLAAHPRCPAIFRNRLRRLLALRLEPHHRREPSFWAAHFRQVLDALGWPGDLTLSSEEFQTRRRFSQLLSELASLDLVWPELTAPAALRFLHHAATSSTFETENRNQPVQIMGVLEAAGASFDHLWVGGMDELSWPPQGALNPFLPLELARRHAMPNTSPARILEFARAVTHRLAASAPEVVFSYVTADGDRTLQPSRLIRSAPERAPTARFTLWLPLAAPSHSLNDSTAPPLDASITAPGGVNAIRLQARCPFHAFAELRLGARPLDRPDLGLDPRTRGTLVHRVLEFCWAELNHSARLQELAPAELNDLIARAIDHALAPENLPPPIDALERLRLQRLTRAWLELEQRRPTPFTVETTEHDRLVQLGPLSLHTRIDRVDRLDDGRLVLIDYKTSSPSLRLWEGDRPDDPQLPVYATTLDQPPAGVFFAQLRAGDVRFTGLTADPNLVPNHRADDDFAERLAAWKPVLEKLAAAFASGDATVDPKEKSKTCQWCHLQLLCRIHEKSLREEE
jgi:probable DNA repair protein